MTDLFGNELAIGDIVASQAKNYRGLILAKIVAFTPKQARVEYRNTWNYGGEGRVETYLVWPDWLIKKP